MADTQHPAPQRGITADGFLTDSWYLGAVSAALKPGTQRRIMMLGEPVVIGRTPAGEAFALRDICPHRLVPLSAGRQVETAGEWTLQCPYHGWRFGTDGGCRLVPSLTEDSPFDASRVKVRRYPVHEASGAVYVYVADDPRSDAPPAAPPPDFGRLPGKPGFVVEHVFDGHMDDAVAGLIDPAHVPFVHSQWWWRPPSAGFRLKEKSFEPTARGWALGRHAPPKNSILYRLVFGRDVESEIWFELPGFRWEIASNARMRLLSLTCMTPIDPSHTQVTQLTWWTGAPLLNLAIPLAKRMGRTFLAQDAQMVGLQGKNTKYQKTMLWVGDADEQGKWYRMIKREWAASRTEGRDFVNPIQPRTLRWMS